MGFIKEVITLSLQTREIKKMSKIIMSIYNNIWIHHSQSFADETWENGKTTANFIINLYETHGVFNDVLFDVTKYHADNFEIRPSNLIRYISFTVLVSRLIPHVKSINGNDLILIDSINKFYPKLYEVLEPSFFGKYHNFPPT